MKHTIKLMALAMLLIFHSCNQNETKNQILDPNAPDVGISPNDLNNLIEDHSCATISQFGPDSYWTNTLVNASETNFLIQQNNKASNLFGLNNVPLYFAGGPGTFNALSFGPPNNYIVWGEGMIRGALRYGRAAVAYIAAHEVAHQVQFRQGYPSVRGASNIELEADGFAGYYLRKGYSSNWQNVSAAYNFSQSIAGASGSSHGSAAQRRSAVRLGWLLAEWNLSNRDLDYYFFYYYESYVLPGKGKTAKILKPKNISQEIHNFILTKVEELNKINSGKISEEEFTNLN